MKYLLDTHVLLCALVDDPRLSAAQREVLDTGELYVSAASVWEVGIKRALGKLAVPGDVFEVAHASGVRPLPITWAHADAAAALPAHHSDPFDRMLIAQAVAEGMALVSGDGKVGRYDVALVT
ncbi:type II toxin-antitoxin system VapC family toxin [uncultured Tateyamaria sp.]|uniref:type II toxin-antitoxin system VapC family toxin n=1 Tax=Tateyamaria sp. 1078 TaxID=3417464 RepID=UPI0026228B09|nr:type II toxin-antitoxin system VapC family toxin [uncultured Tateyamaria sp.]